MVVWATILALPSSSKLTPLVSVTDSKKAAKASLFKELRVALEKLIVRSATFPVDTPLSVGVVGTTNFLRRRKNQSK